MAITYLGEVAQAGTGKTADISALPLQAGDVLLIQWFGGANTQRNFDIVTDVDDAVRNIHSNGVVDTVGAVGVLTIGASVPAELTFSGAVYSGHTTGFNIRAYRGVEAVSFAVVKAGGNNPIAASTVDVTRDGSLVVVGAALVHQTGSRDLSHPELSAQTVIGQDSTYDLVACTGQITRDTGAYAPADFATGIANPKTWFTSTFLLTPLEDPAPEPDPSGFEGPVGKAATHMATGTALKHAATGRARTWRATANVGTL
ncbi:hypothetical protein [Pacificoceanicola onchidii]|uniref:hypothetical protein n=1 Tax=Pacificoceanicola onchidii TaxID=2562685 RepID=UPI0010A54BD6|nr:hypothetical protein [Pacificoceanicola onchidii]